MSNLDFYKNISKEKFIGDAKVVGGELPVRKIRPFKIKDDVESVPFMDKYTAKITNDGVVVYDGDKVVGLYSRKQNGKLTRLEVLKDYRKQGIGTNMVFQWCLKYTPKTLASFRRNPLSHKVVEKVYDLLVAEANKV